MYDTNLGDIVIKGVSKLDQCTECKNIFVSGQQMDQWNKELLKTLASKRRTLKPKEMIYPFWSCQPSLGKSITAIPRASKY